VLNNETVKVCAKDCPEIFREKTLMAYESSGLFTSVSMDSAKADIIANVEITDKGETSAMNHVTGFSLFLIPSSVGETLTITTTYKDISGKPLNAIVKTEKSTMWMHLFMVILAPFHPLSTIDEVLYDLNRNTILEAHTRGFF